MRVPGAAVLPTVLSILLPGRSRSTLPVGDLEGGFEIDGEKLQQQHGDCVVGGCFDVN